MAPPLTGHSRVKELKTLPQKKISSFACVVNSCFKFTLGSQQETGEFWLQSQSQPQKNILKSGFMLPGEVNICMPLTSRECRQMENQLPGFVEGLELQSLINCQRKSSLSQSIKHALIQPQAEGESDHKSQLRQYIL